MKETSKIKEGLLAHCEVFIFVFCVHFIHCWYLDQQSEYKVEIYVLYNFESLKYSWVIEMEV